MQCCTNVEDVGPTLYKSYTNVLCLLGIRIFYSLLNPMVCQCVPSEFSSAGIKINRLCYRSEVVFFMHSEVNQENTTCLPFFLTIRAYYISAARVRIHFKISQGPK